MCMCFQPSWCRFVVDLYVSLGTVPLLTIKLYMGVCEVAVTIHVLWSCNYSSVIRIREGLEIGRMLPIKYDLYQDFLNWGSCTLHGCHWMGFMKFMPKITYKILCIFVS